MITPYLKDQVLNYLIDQFNKKNSTIYFQNLSESVLSNDEIVEMILKQFLKEEYLQEYYSFSGEGTFHFTLTANAFDLQYLGGFVSKEALLKLNIEKLELELDSLQQSSPETFERITTILANITTTAAFFIK